MGGGGRNSTKRICQGRGTRVTWGLGGRETHFVPPSLLFCPNVYLFQV